MLRLKKCLNFLFVSNFIWGCFKCVQIALFMSWNNFDYQCLFLFFLYIFMGFCVNVPLPPLRGQHTVLCHPRWLPTSGLAEFAMCWGGAGFEPRTTYWFAFMDCIFKKGFKKLWQLAPFFYSSRILQLKFAFKFAIRQAWAVKFKNQKTSKSLQLRICLIPKFKNFYRRLIILPVDTLISL